MFFAQVNAVVFSTNINFNEAAFPTANIDLTGTTQSYNVLDDATGLELTTLNGDLADFSVNFQSSGAGASTEFQTTSSGRFTSRNSFSGTPTSNNSGNRRSTTITINFADHLTVTDLSFDVLSANSGASTFEFSVFEFLDANGDIFGAPVVVDPFLGADSPDSPTLGAFVLDDRTATGVGTNDVTPGANGANENFTVTGDLGFSDVGLAAGTTVGGLRVTTYLEDIRGIDDGTSTLTSSLIDFTFGGEISAVPEPKAYGLILGGFFLCFVGCRRRMKEVQK